jgi:hypothetical protein
MGVFGALKSIDGIMTALVAIPVVLFLAWVLHMALAGNHALVAAKTQAAQATVAAGQAQAAQAAQTVILKGDARQHLDLAIHQENAHDIEAAPGASNVLDDALVDAINRGVCRYDQDQPPDPRCAGLLGADPAVVQNAGADPGPPR